MPTVQMALLDPSDSAVITLDWSGDLASGVTLADVDHTVPSPLTRVSQATSSGSGISQVRVSGARTGAVYSIRAAATLSNGEIINSAAVAVGFRCN